MRLPFQAACRLAPQLAAYKLVCCALLRCFALLVLQNPKVTADRAFNGFGTNYTNSPEPIYGTQVSSRLASHACGTGVVAAAATVAAADWMVEMQQCGDVQA
jgi:hypothetical protein